MKKIINSIVAIITIVAITSVSLNAYDRHDRNQNRYRSNERDTYKPKELTPEEKECINDVDTFIFSYRIIQGTHDRVKDKFGYVPAIMASDLKKADEAYEALKSHIGRSRIYVTEIIDHGKLIGGMLTAMLPTSWYAVGSTPQWAVQYCDKMYNNELNQEYGLNLAPTEKDPFLESNYVCHTSYKKALKNLENIVAKYSRAGHPCTK